MANLRVTTFAVPVKHKLGCSFRSAGARKRTAGFTARQRELGREAMAAAAGRGACRQTSGEDPTGLARPAMSKAERPLDPATTSTHMVCVVTLPSRVPIANWQRWLPLVKRRLRRDPARGSVAMTFRPLHDHVLVRRIEAAAKTAGGIIIPDTAQEKPQEGEIVSVGSGTRSEDGTVTPLDVRAGDTILFGKWSGGEVRLDGEDLLIIKEADILGVVG
jgi:chaperonin GroES